MANYDRARATKEERNYGGFASYKPKKSTTKKVKKAVFNSPVLIIIVLAIVVGAVGGFFLFKNTSKFFMKDFYVNGVKSAEADYVVVDVSEHKENKISESVLEGKNLTMEEIYSSLQLEDKGVSITFLGSDISSTIKTRFLYREDISHDISEVSSIDVRVAGVYYIEYTSSHFAFKNVTLIRTIIVTGVEIDG